MNPVSPVVSLLQDLHTKVSNHATAEVIALKAHSERCREKAQDDNHQQETLNADFAFAKAAMENDVVEVESSSLVNVIAASDVELATVKAVREKEGTDYNKSEAELVHVMDTLERGVSIIHREMSKNPAFLQENIDTRNMNNVMTALIAVVDAAPEVKIGELNTVLEFATSRVATHKALIL